MAPSKQKGLQRISIQDTEQPPVLINPPQADLWFTWLPLGEPWPRALHSRPCQHLEEPLAALPHQDGFPWEQIQAASPAQLQRCMGAEKLGGSCSALESKRWSVLSLEVNFSPPSLVLASFFFTFFFFLDLLFRRKIRPESLHSPHGIGTRSFFLSFDSSFPRHKSEYSDFSPELSPPLLLIYILKHILKRSSSQL